MINAAILSYVECFKTIYECVRIITRIFDLFIIACINYITSIVSMHSHFHYTFASIFIVFVRCWLLIISVLLIIQHMPIFIYNYYIFNSEHLVITMIIL